MRWYWLIFAWCFLSINGRSQTYHSDWQDGVVYFRVHKGVQNSEVESAINVLRTSPKLTGAGEITYEQPFIGFNDRLTRTYRLYFSNFSELESVRTALEEESIIDFAEPSPYLETDFVPNDLHSNQWHLDKIKAPLAWDVAVGDEEIVIAIVDNAVRISHEDLKNNLWVNTRELNGIRGIDDDLNGYVDDVNGYDVSDGDGNPNPPAGNHDTTGFSHGTHVAGIASAATDNNLGIAGVGYNCSIMAVKCSPDNSTNNGRSLPNAYDGVLYAIRAEADIINMSWGGSSGIFITGEEIINLAANNGIVLVGAAGNDDSNEEHFPAAYAPVISVGATDRQDAKSSFSNFGSTIDFMAPGNGIYSCLGGTDNSYGFLSGTSMATPIVSGLCGLLLADNPSADVRKIIANSSDNVDQNNPEFVGDLGSGRVNAAAAFNNDMPAAIPSTNFNEHVKVSPIGTALYFHNLPKDIYNAKVMDLNGRVVFSRLGFQNNNRLSLPQMKDGIYLVSLKSPTYTFTSKFIMTK